MVDLIHTYGDEEVLKDYGLDPWDRGDVTQLADYIISRGNKETDLAPQGKRTIGLKNEEIELSSLIDKDRMKDAAMEGTMRGLVGKVNKMMEISAKIERTLRREPELDFKDSFEQVHTNLEADLEALHLKTITLKKFREKVEIFIKFIYHSL